MLYCFCFPDAGWILFPRESRWEAGIPQKKTYTVKAYLRHGNATTDFSVRCEVITTGTGESRNLYWGYRQEEAQVQWKDDHTVEINGKTLDAENDTYDWRVDGE